MGGVDALPRNSMKTKLSLSIIIVMGLLVSIETSANDRWWGGPFGGYCRGAEWGWYGAKKQIRTAQQAKKLVEEYYVNEDITIGKVAERQFFFEVDINDKNNSLIDVVIVDKRTGRIRSIY
ncbi:hypothetical protein ASN18_3140 [Candidatus Magnetominusculus xianensis]|uniref:PepSY domain-containing protein n=1 Tax=Candidatus Magnetominusculus xianensis TaxID=1748249 RepID=A0ABR5SBF8_9BACT|nr:hypothetical protein ASN18_3140 [Candidatus Magnetominusculus xianensis]